MHFFRARFLHHANDLATGRSSDDGVVYSHHAFTFDQCANWIELELDAKVPNRLRGLNKSAADIVIPDQAHAKRYARLKRVADRRGHARVRHRNDNVGLDGMFLRQQPAQRFATLVYRAPKDNAVRPRKIYMLKNALL